MFELGINIHDVINELCKIEYSFIFSPFNILYNFIIFVLKETNKYFSSFEKHTEVISPFLLLSLAENVKYKFMIILLLF